MPSQARRAELFLPFSLLPWFFLSCVDLFADVCSPPTHPLVVLVRLVHLINTSRIRLSPFSTTVDTIDPSISFGARLDPCSKLPQCRSLLVRRTWHIGYSGYHPILPKLLGRRPLLPGIGSWFVGDIVFGGLPSVQQRNLHLPVFALPSGIGHFAASLTTWPCRFGCGR